jgi:tetratricopeptide (TPR) repeat protein
MEKSAKENYLDFRPHLFLGRLHGVSYQVSGNPEELKKASYYLEKAIALGPANQQGYWYLGELKFSEGRKEEAVALFQKAIDLEPRLLRAHWYLVLAYKFSDNYQSAGEKLLELQKMGYDWNNNFSELNQAIDILQYLKDDSALLPFYQKAVQLQPDDVQMRFSLAAAYANLGLFDKARETAEQIKEIREIKPEIAGDIDKFIESLPQ